MTGLKDRRVRRPGKQKDIQVALGLALGGCPSPGQGRLAQGEHTGSGCVRLLCACAVASCVRRTGCCVRVFLCVLCACGGLGRREGFGPFRRELV